jgi:hypothetical protein
MAGDHRREGETMQQSYARLAGDRDSDFAVILVERDRVEREGP